MPARACCLMLIAAFAAELAFRSLNKKEQASRGTAVSLLLSSVMEPADWRVQGRRQEVALDVL